MADTDLAAITNAVAQNYAPRILRATNANAPLVSLFPAVPGRGKNVAWVHELDGEDAETYADGADVSSYTTDTKKPATLPWGLYRANGKVTDLSIDVAGTSMSPEEIVDLLGREMVNKARALALKLGTDAYSGAGSNALYGLESAVADDNTYATIDRTQSANAKWRAKVIDPGSPTAPTIALIRQDLNQIYDLSGEKPDIGLCPTDVWNKIASLFDVARQYVVSTMPNGGPIEVRGGVQAIDIDGCKIMPDRLATANRIYYLNSAYVRWEYLRRVPRAMDESAVEAPLQGNNGPLPLGMVVRPLARTGAALKFSCAVTAQLVLEKPIACGVRLQVSTS